MTSTITLNNNFTMGGGSKLALIAGPCVIESELQVMQTAEALKKITAELEIDFIFKSSYDKANRTSVESFRGPGMDEGLRILEKVKTDLGLPVISDCHTPQQCAAAGEILDMIQIPAFLCRQTDLLVAAAKTGKVVNVKKGQFAAAAEMKHAIGKIKSTGNTNIALTERGNSFGYNNLVVDMTSLPQLRALGVPVVFDATHSTQLPGAGGTFSGGRREMIPFLARAAVATGIDGLFMEVHPKPEDALCDATNQFRLTELKALLSTLIELDAITKALL